jgi:signal transduction histidine kinase
MAAGEAAISPPGSRKRDSPAAPLYDRDVEGTQVEARPDAIEPEQHDAALTVIERRVLVVVRTILAYLAIPLMLGIVVVEVRAGRGSVWLGLELFTVLGATAALSTQRTSHQSKLRVVVAMFAAIAGLSLVIFGPIIGTGLLFLAAATTASFFLDRRGRLITLGVLTLELGAATVAAFAGVLHPTTFAPAPGEWARMSATSVLVLAALSSLIAAVQRAMHGAIAAEASARAREHAAQAEREQALRAAGAAHRLEAIGRLAGGVAHDFNNALVVIRSTAAVLRAAQTDEDRAALHAELDAGIVRAVTTARQLLVFGRSDPEDAATCRPSTRLELIAGVVGRVLPANISVVAELSPTPAIELGPAEFDQIVLNLVFNARDAMPDGGRIALTCRHADDRVVVEVRDDGTGMPPDVRARIFEPFFTTKGDAGTGLGLATVWAQVTRRGGTIDVDSSPGQGTTCRLAFTPVAAAVTSTSGAGHVAWPSVAAGPGLGPRILLLEDQVDVRRAMERVLRLHGLEVDSAASVAHALERIAGGDYALLLTDGMLLDGPSGPAILAFRDKAPSQPIIVCSGYLDPGSFAVDEELRDGLHFLPKPFEPAELLALIERALPRSTG